MVRLDSVDHRRRLVETAGDLCTHQGMGPTNLMGNRFADVMQECRPPDFYLVGSHLGCEHAADVCRLDEMVEHVLAVAGPILESSEQGAQLGVHLAEPNFDTRPFSRGANRLFDFVLGFCGRLLERRWMDPPTIDETFEGSPGDLSAHRVEGGNRLRLGRVVNDEVDARNGLEAPDVSSVSADDAALHVVRRERDDRYRGFRDHLGCQPLDRRGENSLGATLGLFPRSCVEITHQAHRVPLGLSLNLLEQLGLCRLGVDTRNAFERRASFFLDGLGFGDCAFRSVLPGEHHFFALRQVSRPLFQRCLALGESGFLGSRLDPPMLERGILSVAIRLGLGPRLLLGSCQDSLRLEPCFGECFARRLYPL